MSDLGPRLVIATLGVVFAVLGTLAAANFKDVADRQARWLSARYGPTTMWGRESWFFKNQFWSMRIFGVVLACMGLIMIVAAFTATFSTGS
jgi:hypothetical protein